MGREVDAAISRCYIRRAVGSDGASQPSVHIVAGNLHIVVSTEEAGQALQRETQVDPLSEVIPALAEGRGDHVAVNGAAAFHHNPGRRVLRRQGHAPCSERC